MQRAEKGTEDTTKAQLTSEVPKEKGVSGVAETIDTGETCYSQTTWTKKESINLITVNTENLKSKEKLSPLDGP